MCVPQTCMSVRTHVLYTVFIVCTFAQGYHCIAANLSGKDPRLEPPARPVPLRRSADLADNLRRQLMRDNYDYQTANTDDEHNKGRQQDKQKGGNSNQRDTRSNVHDQLGNHVVTADTRERWHADPNYTHESYYKPTHKSRHAIDPDYANDEHIAEDKNYAIEMRDALGPDFAPYKRGQDDSAAQDKPEAYDPTYAKRRDAYNARYNLDRRDAQVAKQPMQVAPVTYPARGARVEDNSRDSRDTGDAIDTADVLTVGSAQGAHGAPDKQYPDDSKQPDDKQTYSLEVKASRGTDAETVQDTPELNSHASHVHHDADKKDKPDTGHAIAKKDLLYYMDDDHMRRHNDVSADLSDRFAAAEPAARRARTRTRHAEPDASFISLSESEGENIDRAADHADSAMFSQYERSTVSTDNVTYKLLTMRSRGGRRSGARRLVEERAPGGGVALLSLDRAPLPQFRLPRSRRQYMHERHDKRPPLAGATHRHHHHTKH